MGGSGLRLPLLESCLYQGCSPIWSIMNRSLAQLRSCQLFITMPPVSPLFSL